MSESISKYFSKLIIENVDSKEKKEVEFANLMELTSQLLQDRTDLHQKK